MYFQVKLANSVLRQKISDMDSLQKNLNSSLEYIQKVHNTGKGFILCQCMKIIAKIAKDKFRLFGATALV